MTSEVGATEIIPLLTALAAAQALRERTLAACREAMEQCAAEERALGLPPLRGWSIDEIVPRFRRCALVFEHGLIDYPFVETQLGLFVGGDPDTLAGDVRLIGTYRLITFLNGEVDDDYLEIDVEKPRP